MKKKLTKEGLIKVLKETFAGFSKHKIVKLAAALAYYTVFSLGPMLICIIFLADVFWGRDAVEGKLFEQINELVGSNAAIQIQEIIKNASIEGNTTLTAIIGFATLFIGATTVFSEIQDSINSIWNLKIKDEVGWWKMLITRLLSFSVVVSLGFLLLVSLVLNAVIEGFMTKLQELFPNVTVVLIYVVNIVLTFSIISLLFAIIFRVLPDAKIQWKAVIVGAMVTAALFMIGKFGITLYISQSDVGSTYGAAGSLVVLLVWVYYSSIILYLGAEFTRVYAAHFGERIHPNHYAVWIKQVQVEEGQGSLQESEEKKKREEQQSGGRSQVT